MCKMQLGKKVDVPKLTMLTGLTLLLIPNSLPWTWGNIVGYVDSYFRVFFGLKTSGGTTWMIPLYLALCPVGTAISDVLVKRAGPSWTLITGICLYTFSVGLSYFTVQLSVEALVVTTGAIPGSAAGLLYGLVLCIVSSFKSRYSGILLAITTCGASGGSLVTNEIMTYYINPSNASPNLTIVTGGRSESYFTQHDVIDRVPSSFLVFTGFCLAVHLISFLLIKSVSRKVIPEKSSNNKNEEDGLTSESLSTGSEQCQEISRLLANAECMPQRCRSSDSLHELVISEVKSLSRRDNEHRKRSLSFSGKYPESSADVMEMSSTHGKHRNRAAISQIYSSNEDVDEEQNSKICRQISKSHQTDFTTLQMIKTSVFYVFFLCYTSIDLSYVIINNYYKLYGQNYIKDDHFITNFNTVTVVSALILRFSFGAMMDFIGVKNTFILFQSSLTVTAQAWYFAPMVNKWLYMIITTIFRSLVQGLYIIFSAATLAVFGKTYFARNISVLMSLSLVANLSGPLITEALLRHFGWYSISLLCSLINFSGLCAVLIVLPRK